MRKIKYSKTGRSCIQIQSPLQQRWQVHRYRFFTIPTLAQSLDTFKEQLEELYISRQAQARFSREQQKSQRQVHWKRNAV